MIAAAQQRGECNEWGCANRVISGLVCGEFLIYQYSNECMRGISIRGNFSPREYPSLPPVVVASRTGGLRLGHACPSISIPASILWSSWQLWKERNSKVFNSTLSSVSEVLQSILSEGHLWSLAGIANFRVFWESSGLCPSHYLES